MKIKELNFIKSILKSAFNKSCVFNGCRSKDVANGNKVCCEYHKGIMISLEYIEKELSTFQ